MIRKAARLIPGLVVLLTALAVVSYDGPTNVATSAQAARQNIWVFFTDKGISGPDLDAALDRAGRTLTARTARRRVRNGSLGTRPVDARDLPVFADYLAHGVATGARLRHTSRWLNAASFAATPSQIELLAQRDEVAAIRPVARARRAAVPTPPSDLPAADPKPGPHATPSAKAATAIDYGANLDPLLQINVPAVHDLGLTGAGIVVGLLDTGFRTLHEALDHIPVLGAWDFVNNDPVVDNEGADLVSSRSHGTMVLSTVAADEPGQLVAPAFGASVLLGKTEDISQEVILEEDNWVAGLEWAEGLGADLISSSVGYSDWYVYEDLDGDTAITTRAADLAAARGLLVVMAAGNDRGTTGYLIAPGDADSVVTVGAVDSLGDVTYFSSPGPTVDGRTKPDVAALGLYNPVCDPNDDAAYATASGTSFATPLVAAAAALMLERVPDLTPMQVREALRQTASQPLTPDNDLGWGIIDALAAALWFGPSYSHSALPDTVDAAGPFEIIALITARLGVDPASLTLHYRVDAGAWQALPMGPYGLTDVWSADIPAPAVGETVDYYLSGADLGGHGTVWPVTAPAGVFTFTVEPEATPADDVACRPALEMLNNAPNPFNPQTTISFRLGRAGQTRLSIFDARGMLVRVLLDRDLAAGDHQRVWDGRDTQGRAVGSGAYVYRLESADQMLRRKMLLLR